MKILLVEDEKHLTTTLKVGLEYEGYSVDICDDGLKAKQMFQASKNDYSLIILDIGLPNMNGFQLCSHIRAQGNSVPILMLTARSATEDKVSTLNNGADDYMTKPFSYDELLARIRALYRRPVAQILDVVKIRDVTLYAGQHRVTRSGRELEVTKKEFILLDYLMRRPNKVITREELYSKLWDTNNIIFSNTVDVHIKNLRNKLQYDNENFIETVRGVGFILKN